MSIGTVLIRVIPQKDTTQLSSVLRESGYGVTEMDVEGMKGKVKMIMSIINRKDIRDFIEIVNIHNPKAFYTIGDVNAVKDGYIKNHRSFSPFDSLNFLRRKGK
jgi:uncharacterized protein YebE (UPF0316 family)